MFGSKKARVSRTKTGRRRRNREPQLRIFMQKYEIFLPPSYTVFTSFVSFLGIFKEMKKISKIEFLLLPGKDNKIAIQAIWLSGTIMTSAATSTIATYTFFFLVAFFSISFPTRRRKT